MMFIYLTSFWFGLAAQAVAQTDSLRGYGEFRFGETRMEVSKKLQSKGITFRNNYSKSDKRRALKLSGQMFLIYNDYVTIDLDMRKVFKPDITFNMEIRLTFDSLNSEKLFKAHVDVDAFAESVADAKGIFSSLQNIFVEKYGSSYQIVDCLDSSASVTSNFRRGRSIAYIWNKLDGEVELSLMLEDFYNLIIEESFELYFPQEHGKGGVFKIGIDYSSDELKKKSLDNTMQQLLEKKSRKKEEIKSKF